MKPIWVPSELTHLFERIILRHKHTPELWDAEVCPVPRVHLLFGQSGSGMLDAVTELCRLHSITFLTIEGSGFVDQCKGQMSKAMSYHIDPKQFWCGTEPMPEKKPNLDLLIINKAEMLARHQELFESTLNLTQVLRFPFIIVISTEVPVPDQHPFWQQFEEVNWILMSLPTKDFFRSLLQYYLNEWETHWMQQANCIEPVHLTEECWNQLVDACGYCTPEDARTFIHKVTRYILESTEPNICITWELLTNRNLKFLYNPTGIDGVLCIVNRDTQHIQSYYETRSRKGSTTALTTRQVEERLGK